GILPFAEGKMMEQIRARGRKLGDPEGCVVCHGGTPSATTKEEAHRSEPQPMGPERFYPNPGSFFVAERTCGQCHQGYARRLLKSSTGTETAKIHRNLCRFALNETASGGTEKRFGSYAIEDDDGKVPIVGSAVYKEFMTSFVSDSDLFTERLESPPVLADGVTQSRCVSCHIPKAQNELEDQHGTGCSSCHVPYRAGGSYLGSDPTIDRNQTGKLLLHRLQGTANTTITLRVNGDDSESFRGILLDNCFRCHNDVRHEDLNPIGSAISHYGDSHETHMGGTMLCQDCHTSIEMHGDGNIPLSSRAQVEIRCEDCHGTVDKAPWELPIGYGGEPGKNPAGPARGLVKEPPDIVGAFYDSQEGYLLTSRGNPFGNVVKDGERVLLHSATGQQLAVPILKQIRQHEAWKSPLSRQAMFEVKEHGERMACTTCHGDRVQPPCLGCHASESQSRKE
ncbi:MAG TPA: cytochrome C, partial [Vicinamibacteria bacterium]|nr:cytochrome C [Vicinamibacteria bacterium]